MIQTTIRLPEKLYKCLKQEAKERGLSVNSLIITILHGSRSGKEKRDEEKEVSLCSYAGI